MTDDIEGFLRSVPPVDTAGLAGMEGAVWRRVSERSERARVAQVRIAAVVLAVAVGVANGGMMLLAPKPEPSEMRIFTVSAGLSPLVGLDVRG